MPGSTMTVMTAPRRYDEIVAAIRNVLGRLFGRSENDIPIDVAFLDLGADSLFLLQTSQTLEAMFGVKVPFRLLLDQIATVDALATYIDQQLAPAPLPNTPPLHPATPPQPYAAATGQPQQEALDTPQYFAAAQLSVAATLNGPEPDGPRRETDVAGPNTAIERIMLRQLQVMAEQLEVLREKVPARQPAVPPQIGQAVLADPRSRTAADAPDADQHPAPGVPPAGVPNAAPVGGQRAQREDYVAYQALPKGSTERMTPQQQQHLEALIARVTKRTRESQRLTQAYRPMIADSRSVAHFRTLWKDMVYQIIVERAAGARVWDVDGNEYVDISMGFGALLYGHSPPFIVDALQNQVVRGIRLGPQTNLAGEVAALICELTGVERVAFCNSGTEAVMSALRLARAITGRTKIAQFAGSYHGTFDGVLVKGIRMPDGTLRAAPMAPGVPPAMIEEVLVLDYGNPRSLDLIRAHAHELAAVLVEATQSRRPDLRPKEFLHELRQITAEAGVALIFDEVVSGFRTHPGGIQALFDVRADLVIYGKAVGGGMPIGVVAGKAAFMDAIDGGMWQFGDASYPQATTTLFVGTFFKHPLVMSAALASLTHLKQCGPQLQERLNQRTTRLVDTLNAYFEENQIPIRMNHFGSLFNFTPQTEVRFMELFYYHLLEQGVYVWEGRVCYLSTAHTDEDIEHIVRAVKASVEELRAGGFLPPLSSARATGDDAPAPQDADRSHGPSRPVVRIDAPAPLAAAHGTDSAGMRAIPLLEAQKQLWVLTQLGDEPSRAYNESISLRLRGVLDLPALRVTIQAVFDRHEALRITIGKDGAHQLIAPPQQTDIPLIDLTPLGESDREAQLRVELTDEARKLFDLVQGPLLRVRIFKVAETNHLVVFTLHHIICDGWSFGVLLREIGALYSAECQRLPCRLDDPTPFSQYVEWQRRWRQSPELSKAEAYWHAQFVGTIPVLELPADRPRPAVQTYTGRKESTVLDSLLHDDLRRLSARHGCTLFVTLLAGFKLLLHRLTSQDDVIVGIPAAGQLAVGSAHLIGYCVNLLPLRNSIAGNPSFAEYLRSVKETVLEAYDHQHYPFIELIQKLNMRRDPSRLPLVEVLFNMDPSSGPDAFAFHGLDVDLLTNPTDSAKFDLSFEIVGASGGLRLDVEYNTDLFDPATIQRWIGTLMVLLRGLVADPERRVADVPILTEAEEQQLLAWNATGVDFPGDSSMHKLFEAQVKRVPDRVAVVFEDVQLTYQELNRRANQVAHELRSLGIEPEAGVGVCLARSPEQIIGMIGILAAGGAYVPLDPSSPPERIAFMLEDSGVKVLLTTADRRPPTADLIRGRMSGVGGQDEDVPAPDPWPPTPESWTVVDLIADWPTIARHPTTSPNVAVLPDNLAYVIYTSGSTGRPKGVMIAHRAIGNRLRWGQSLYQLGEDDRVLHKASCSFDVSIWECFGALAAGACVVLARPDEPLDSAYLVGLIAAQQISVADFPPPLLQVCLEERGIGSCTALRIVGCGGELWPGDLQQRFFDRLPADLYNLYGPTEAAVDVAAWKCERERPQELVPLGGPMANTQLYLLDRRLHPVPIGVAAELYIGGVGLARGYLNRPDLTAERFVPNTWGSGVRVQGSGGTDSFAGDKQTSRQADKEPAQSAICNLQSAIGSRLYRTGDLVRYSAGGAIEFLGRVDRQVKLRGFRIEPEEIEAALAEHPAVRESVVVVQEHAAGNKRLIGYVVPSETMNAERRTMNEPELSSSSLSVHRSSLEHELRTFLTQRLPSYMVPAAFVVLEMLPRTPSGKVDRHALPPIMHAGREPESALTAPRTPVEQLLTDIWAQVLGVGQVGKDQNFFEIGGDSILAIQISIRANEAGLKLAPKQLFQHPTIAQLALVVSASEMLHPEQAHTATTVPLTPIQHYFFELNLPAPHHFNQAMLFDAPPELDPTLLKQALQHVLLHHDALRMRFVAGESGWQQIDAGLDAEVSFTYVDLSGLAEEEQRDALAAQANQLHSSLCLSEGPLVRAAFFDHGLPRAGRLLIVIHHLLVDVTSWSILLEDLETAYTHLRRGEAVRLPAMTTPFKRWAERLVTYARSTELPRELDIWLASAAAPRLPLDDLAGRAANTVASSRTISATLSVEETRVLLHEVPRAYRTLTEEVLLTALTDAFAPWLGEPVLLVDLEGNGREASFTGISLARTVGWFTSMFPVLLDLRSVEEPGAALKAVKERLRRVPDAGLGYGVLRYLSQDEASIRVLRAMPRPEICFLYLGQAGPARTRTSLFNPTREAAGSACSPQGARRYLLEVTAEVVDEQLRVSWTYSRNAHRRATIEQLSEHFKESLRALMVHCLSPDVGGYTPSDFADAHLSQAELDRIVTELDAFTE